MKKKIKKTYFDAESKKRSLGIASLRLLGFEPELGFHFQFFNLSSNTGLLLLEFVCDKTPS